MNTVELKKADRLGAMPVPGGDWISFFEHWQEIGRLERTQAAHTVLLSIITIAVLIPLVQSTLAG